MSGGPGDRRHRDTRTANRRSGEQTPRAWGRGPTRKRPFRPLRWAWLLLLVALLAPAYDLFLPAGWRPARERRTVVIERGESLHNIATELQRVGLIRSQVGFLVLARGMQLDRSVKAGQYSFRVGITVPALLRALDKGMFGLNLVTIPEGLMISETARLIQRQVGIRAAAIDSLARDPVMLDSLEVSAPSLEGWLAPDSYEWLPGTSPEVILRTMVARTRDRVQRATAGYDSLPLGMNAHEVLTLASIVESESRAEEERPRIARVYLNRLDRGMLLQADPTVGYALGRGPRSRLTFKDLRVESAYNTYRHEGLPPGPICSPGLSAIEAVMHATPGTTDLYFVANGQGRHIFAPSYEKHLANIAFVKGRKAAADAAARRETAGRAAPDSTEKEPASTRALPLAAATKTTAGTTAVPPHTPATTGTATTTRPSSIKTAATTPVPDAPVPATGTQATDTTKRVPAPAKLASKPAGTTTATDTTRRTTTAAKPTTRPTTTAADTTKKAVSKPAAKPTASAADTVKKAVAKATTRRTSSGASTAPADTAKKAAAKTTKPAASKPATPKPASTTADSSQKQ
ncbi:MAG TPA: endolytic transglycosylase MltG [Methylomirabilota bacterium]|nr:endolytic transglycosylase MltG [Methylomirabilota bacterium]